MGEEGGQTGFRQILELSTTGDYLSAVVVTNLAAGIGTKCRPTQNHSKRGMGKDKDLTKTCRQDLGTGTYLYNFVVLVSFVCRSGHQMINATEYLAFLSTTTTVDSHVTSSRFNRLNYTVGLIGE
jgi:hypothetical protein